MVDSVNRPQILEHLSKSLNITIYDCKWIPCSARFVVLGSYPKATGSIQVFELDGAEVKQLAEYQKPVSLKCGTFGASSLATRWMATGDFDGTLSLWDLDAAKNAVSNVRAHSSSVNAIDGCGGKCDGHGPPEIATCGRDGCVHVFDVRQLQSPVASFEPTTGSAKRECWTVAFGNSFNDEERCLLAGYDNGDIKLFDLRMNQVRWEAHVPNAVCGVQFDRPDIQMNKFVVACLESQFHVFDARTQHPQEGFARLKSTTDFKSTCWSAQHLPQNREIWMVTHGDGTAALYKYRYPPQRVRKAEDGKPAGVVGTVDNLSYCNLSSQPISCFDWSPDREGLFVCGALDQRVRIGIVTKLHRI